LWLRIHLVDPRLLSYDSPMPSYAWLFRDQRGNDLVAYLAGLKSPDSLQYILSEEACWNSPASAESASGKIDGARLFSEYCATCHTPAGEVRTRWAADFRHPPPELNAPTIEKWANGEDPIQLRIHLARSIKFGIPGTDMPGHEYMLDAQIDALVDYLTRRH
jgi:cytochrome c oxidase cbb3-type subunit 2